MQEDLYYPHTFVQDLLWNTLNYVSEPVMNRWPFSKIRERALQKVIKYLRYGAETSRYITLGCVEKVSTKVDAILASLLLCATAPLLLRTIPHRCPSPSPCTVPALAWLKSTSRSVDEPKQPSITQARPPPQFDLFFRSKFYLFFVSVGDSAIDVQRRYIVSMLAIWRRNSTLYMPTEAPIQGRYISKRERAVLASVPVVFDHEFAGFRGHGNPLIPGLCNTLSRAAPARRVSTIVVACASRSSQASFDSRRRLRHCRPPWTPAPCASSSHLRRPAPLRESSVACGCSHLAPHLRRRRHCAVRRAIRLPLRSQRRASPLLLCLSRRPPPTTAGCLNEFFICTIFRQISDLRTLVFISDMTSIEASFLLGGIWAGFFPWAVYGIWAGFFPPACNRTWDPVVL
ncbi:alpha-amyrin synthase [Sarracenia purpurea var. burkii]